MVLNTFSNVAYMDWVHLPCVVPTQKTSIFSIFSVFLHFLPLHIYKHIHPKIIRRTSSIDWYIKKIRNVIWLKSGFSLDILSTIISRRLSSPGDMINRWANYDWTMSYTFFEESSDLTPAGAVEHKTIMGEIEMV